MFDKQLFGYDKDQVELEISSLGNKIICQEKDIEYLRNENGKLKKQIKNSKKSK